MTRSRALAIALAAATTMLAGCHTMKFQVAPEPHDRVVHDRKSFYFWGLYPTKQVDVGAICPHGVAAIREQTSFTDGLFAFPFLGLWEFRSSWYYCLPETPAGPQS